MNVAQTTQFELGWIPELPDPTAIWDPISWFSRVERDLILVRVEDDFGRSEIGIEIERKSDVTEPRLQVLIMGPDGGIGQTTLTVIGPSDTIMCHDAG